MARLEPARPGPFTRAILRYAKWRYGDLTPTAIQAHHPLLMNGYGALEFAFEHSHAVPEKLKALVEMKAAALTGCEWCLDIGSDLAGKQGVTERQLLELNAFRDSDAFDDDEKLVLEYAEGISRTPVDVSDELFARLRERFDERQIVELTWAAVIENLRGRFNWALGIESQGFSEGAVCARPATVEV